MPKKIKMSSNHESLWLAENWGCVTIFWDTCKIRTLIFFTANQFLFVEIMIVGDNTCVWCYKSMFRNPKNTFYLEIIAIIHYLDVILNLNIR